jgi:hypothetical protein
MPSLGRQITRASPFQWPYSHASNYDSAHSLPRRVDDIFNLADDLRSELEDLGGSFGLSFVLNDLLPEQRVANVLFPLAITYVYCPPCVCQLQTAVQICDTASSTVHNYQIRPDDRLTTSCCIRQDRVDGLRSIYDAVRHSESLASSRNYSGVPIIAKYIDMVWLEGRLHFLESGDSIQLPSRKAKTSRVVVLSEAEHLRPLTTRFSCSKVPQASEIWRLDLSDASNLIQQYCGTFISKSHVVGEAVPDVSESNTDSES